MTLDPATLVVVACIMSLVVGGLLFFSWLQDRRIDALAWWSATCTIAAGASLLFLLGGTEMHSPGRVLANAFFALGYSVSYAAARRFNDRSVSWVAVAAGPLLWLIAVWGFEITFVERVVMMSLMAAGYGLVTAHELWNGPDRLVSQRAAAVVTALNALYFLSRIVMGPGVSPSFSWTANFGATFDQAWVSMVGLVILLYVMMFGFLIMSMAKEKTDLEHRRAALIDPLTGVANRRGFLAAATRRLDDCARRDEQVAVLLFDLDLFKTINDRFGHQSGDEILMDFCAAAGAALPPDSLFGRLGGEEFAAMVSGEPALSALDLAERIRAGFAQGNRLAGRDSPPTVSVGVANGGGRTLMETLLAGADGALYRAKAAGRDRVAAAEGSADRAAASNPAAATLRPAHA